MSSQRPAEGKQGGTNEDREYDIIQQAGWDCGMVSSTRWMSTAPMPNVPKQLTRANAKDIVKRGSIRKGRVLCLFADSIRPMKGGALGVMKNLDTKCPFMDMEFPEGVVRFHGTLVFPKNKYLSLKVGSNDVLCEDVFESAILFSKVEWTGTDGTAGSSLPQSMIDRIIHKTEEKEKDDDVPTQDSALENSSRRRSRGISLPKEEKEEEEKEEENGASQGRRSSGRRASGSKRPKYNEQEEFVDLCGSSSAATSE